MSYRQQHQQEVHSFLQKHFSMRDWVISLPHGSGMETYVVQGNERTYFVKVGAPVEKYLATAEIGLTPPVLAAGHLRVAHQSLSNPSLLGESPLEQIIETSWKKLPHLSTTCIIIHA